VFLDLSHDNKWLALSVYDPQEDLFVVRTDGSDPRQLTDDIHRDRGPRWSQDDKHIVFYSDRTGSYEAWSINFDGSELTPLTKNSVDGTIYYPYWIDNGARLVAISDSGTLIVDLSKPLEARRGEMLPHIDSSGTSFSMIAPSHDGRWLVGNPRSTRGKMLPSLVLFSMEKRTYTTLSDPGQFLLWLHDDRRLLFSRKNRVFLIDILTKATKEIPGLPRDLWGVAACATSNDTSIYFIQQTEHAGIWQAGLNPKSTSK
jgi:hypothetical protein